MESDDYHNITEQLSMAAEKINKEKLSLELQDKDKPVSHLSESEEDSVSDSNVYPYDDGEVTFKKVLSPSETNWDTPSLEEEDTYLVPVPEDSPLPTPREKLNTPSPVGPQVRVPPLDQPQSPGRDPFLPIKLELQKVNDELRNWAMAGTKMDVCYYSYWTRLLKDKAIIYYPPAEQFIRVEWPGVRIVA